MRTMSQDPLQTIPKRWFLEFSNSLNPTQQAGPEDRERKKVFKSNLLENGEQSITEWFINIIHRSCEHDKNVQDMIEGNDKYKQ